MRYYLLAGLIAGQCYFADLVSAWQHHPHQHTDHAHAVQLQYTSQTQSDSSGQYHRYGSPGAQRAARTSVTDPAEHDRLAGWSRAQHPAYLAQPPSMLPQQQSAATRPPLPGMYQQPTQQQHLPPSAPQPMQHLPLLLPPGPPQSQGRPRPGPSAGPLPPPPRPPQSQGHPRPVPPAGPLPLPPARTTASKSTAVQPHASDDPALDFFSEHFDALKALQTRGLQPPVPKIKPLDNVTRCRMILPPELPDSASAWSAAHPKAEPTQVGSTATIVPSYFMRFIDPLGLPWSCSCI